MKFKNDISFVFGTELYLYEHQSTVNPNMPLRDLFYVTSLLQGMVANRSLYRTTKVRIPTPRFLVFYNGLEDQPETVEYKLSDLFECLTETPELELTVRVININEGYNNAIVNASRYLHDYVRYVSVVRKNMKTMPVEEAVRKAIDMCIRQGILAEYLSRHRAEVEAMSIFEYDEEQHLKDLHDDGVREGFDKGKEEGIKEGIREGKKQGVEEGKILMLLQLIKEGILDEQDAVRRAGLSREEFLKACEKMDRE